MAKPNKFINPDQDYFDGLLRVNRSEYKPGTIAISLHRSVKRKRLNVGGLGSGKTRTMCEHINNLCLHYPGARVVIARKDLGDLKKTTQTEYLERVVSPETIDRFNINDNTLYYKNGSKCFFMETKTPSNFKSLEILAYGIDEADENEEGDGKDKLITVLDGRLRQKIQIHGKFVPVPYCGIWTYNPTTDDHWLAKLEDNPDPETEVFRSSTYDNQHNLPSDYIPNLLSTLAPWEVNSLVFGNRATRPKGKPVIHGFSYENNVRPIKVYQHLPLRRAWDFGFNHPCCSIFQFDPVYKRFLKLREVIGKDEQLKFFAPKVLKVTRDLVGPSFPCMDTCDPHGDDQRDVGESSVEHLRLHHGVYCTFQRQKIKKGLDEIQELVLTKAKYKTQEDIILEVPEDKLPEESRFLVDPSCKLTIAAYLGGYYRGEDGLPEKDDIHDHPVDCFIAGTKVLMPLFGDKNIEEIKIGEYVKTSKGYSRVINSGCSGVANVYEATFSNGTKIVATPNHPFFTKNRGFVFLRKLTPTDTLYTHDECKSSSTESVLLGKKKINTIDVDQTTMKRGSDISTKKYGKVFMVQFLKIMKSIMLTKTREIMISQTSSVLQLKNIEKNIDNQYQNNNGFTSRSLDHSQQSGMQAKQEDYGIQQTPKNKFVELSTKFASFVLGNTLLTMLQRLSQSIAQITVNQHTGERLPVRLVSLVYIGKRPVYNLTVEDQHEFFANNLLVHNCDRYGVVSSMNAGLALQRKQKTRTLFKNGFEVRGNDWLKI